MSQFNLGDTIITKERIELDGPVFTFKYILVKTRWGYSFFNRDNSVHLFEPVKHIADVSSTLDQLESSEDEFWFLSWDFDYIFMR